jgi:hypothetical protein
MANIEASRGTRVMSPLPIDWLDELTNIEMSKRLRWADKLKVAGEYDLAETVFPDMPEFESQPAQEAA